MKELYFTDFNPAHGGIFKTQLEIARLPTADLEEQGRLFFRLSDDASLIGFIGLEGNGPDRLLRSLVVLNSRRGQGYGRQLVERLETLVRDDDGERLHLLTTKAARFFHAVGYTIAERQDAPPSIASSTEFTALYPASATYMTKALT